MGNTINLSSLSDYTRARFDPAFARKQRLSRFGVEEFHPGHQDQSVHGARNPADSTALADPTAGKRKKDPILPAAKASGGKENHKIVKAGTAFYTSGTSPLYSDDLAVARGRGTGDISVLTTTRDLKFLVHKAGDVGDAEAAAKGAEYDGVVHPRDGESPEYSIFVYENLAFTKTIKRGDLKFEEGMSVGEKMEILLSRARSKG